MTDAQLAPAAERSAEDDVRYLLRNLAVQLTRDGQLEQLARVINRHETTLYGWMRNGDVPKPAALYLEARFGAELAPANRLSKTLRYNI